MATSLSYTVMASDELSADAVTDPQFTRDMKGGHIIIDVSDLVLTSQVTEIAPDNATSAGGTFTITVDAAETAAIAYDALAAAIEAAIELASGVGCAVTGTLNTTIVITFDDDSAHTVTADGANLTGADSPYTLTASDTTDAGDPLSAVTPTIEGYDVASASWYSVLVGSAISTAGTNVLKVYPGIGAVANGAASDVLPSQWRVSLDVTGTVTCSVGANLAA